MKFREATNNESKLITELVFGILTEYGLNPDPKVTDFDLGDIQANYTNRNGCFDLLENDQGNIVATIGLYNIDDKIVELRKMYLLKSERGKGFGKLLMEHAIDKARKLGYKKIILETASVLKEAIQLYKNYGFQPFESDHLSGRCDQALYLEL
jgi:putative acetyltransferase